MSSKLNSGVRYAYMNGGTAWECLRVKADMVLFAGDTVCDPYLSVVGLREDATLPLPLPLPQIKAWLL